MAGFNVPGHDGLTLTNGLPIAEKKGVGNKIMKIFISYAHSNTDKALSLRQALDIHEIWFDQRLNIGQEWWAEIEKQIAATDCFLFLLSPDSLASDYCQKELDLALRLQKSIAPVMIEDVEIPEQLRDLQIIPIEPVAKLLNGIFEIERVIFNPLRRTTKNSLPLAKLSIGDLSFATTNLRKLTTYEAILDTKLQVASVQLDDIQHHDAGEVAINKANRAFEILKKPVFVEHSALAVRAWGGLPGGLTTTFLTPLGLSNMCRMMQPFNDKYAEAISVIAFSDGQMVRKFIGVLPGEISSEPRGNGYSWNNIFIPTGFTKTLGEMTEEEMRSISCRRRSLIEFMRFLQFNYEIS